VYGAAIGDLLIGCRGGPKLRIERPSRWADAIATEPRAAYFYSEKNRGALRRDGVTVIVLSPVLDHVVVDARSRIHEAISWYSARDLAQRLGVVPGVQGESQRLVVPATAAFNTAIVFWE
jgi:cysteine synthase